MTSLGVMAVDPGLSDNGEASPGLKDNGMTRLGVMAVDAGSTIVIEESIAIVM